MSTSSADPTPPAPPRFHDDPRILTIREMQNQHRAWQRHNFPDETAAQAFLGMVEEMGELAHAILKGEQSIRGLDRASAMSLIIDAHCDWIIFSLGFANLNGYDLEGHLNRTWAEVRRRNWVKYPKNGLTE